MFPIVFAFIFWGGLILLIYLNFVKQSKDSPKGTNKQKFATFMKSFIPVGIATLFFVAFTAFYAGEYSNEFGTFLSVVAWGVVIAYGIFLYNKIYIKEGNSTEINKSTPSKKENTKETLTWDESAKPETNKEELKPTEVKITSKEEDTIYAEVAKELQENRNEGVWLKAYTENDGDETKTKIAYTKKRVQELIEELKK